MQLYPDKPWPNRATGLDTGSDAPKEHLTDYGSFLFLKLLHSVSETREVKCH